MAELDDGDVLEAVLSQHGRLLDVERLAVRGRPTARIARALLLVFDVGPVRIEASGASIEVSSASAEAGSVDGFEPAAEEEPWWSLIGSRAPRIWRDLDQGQLLATHFQFRSDDDNPRVVTLELREAHLAISARSRAEWERAR